MKTISKILMSLFVCNAFITYAQQNSWSFKATADASLMFPVIAENIVYTTSTEGIFAAVDIKNGKTLWTFKAEGAVAMPPLVAENIAYFCTKTGNIYALDLKLKKPKWTVNAGEKLICTPVIYKDLVIVYSKNFFLALDKEVGLDMWKCDLKTTGNPLLKISGDLLCFSDNMKITALSPSNGKIIWSYSLPVFGQSDVEIVNDKVYFTNAEKIYCLNLSDGKEIWKKVMNSKLTPSVTVVPAISGNMLYVTCGQEVIAYTADKGQEIWRVTLKTSSDLHSPVVFNNKIYVAESGTKIFCLGIEKGKTEQVFEAPARIDSKFLIQNNWVYFYNIDGTLYAFLLISKK